MAGWHWYRTRRRLRVLPVWRLPLAMLVVAAFLSWLLPLVDRRLAGWEGDYGGQFFPTVDDSAMSNLLSAVAGGMITLTGLVFTALTLAMQFGAAQLSVRLVPILRQDPIMRWSIGVFLATFVYTLLVSVRLAVHEEEYRPVLSVFCAIALSMVCAVLFLALVARVTGVLNSGYLLRSLAAQGRQAVQRTHPHPPGGSVPTAPVAIRDEEPVVVRLGAPPRNGQVLLSFDERRLETFAQAWDVKLELIPVIGDFIAQQAPLFHVIGPGDHTARADHGVLVHCLLFGETHSAATDPAGALRALVDIALKALSPAINDPGRAVQALDHIEDLLVMLAPRLQGTCHAAGGGHLTYRTRSWPDYVCIATDEIRHFGATSIQVQRRLRALYATVAQVCDPAQVAPLSVRLETMDAVAAIQWPQELDGYLARCADPQGLGTESGSALKTPGTST